MLEKKVYVERVNISFVMVRQELSNNFILFKLNMYVVCGNDVCTYGNSSLAF